MPFWEGEIMAGTIQRIENRFKIPIFRVIFDDLPKSVNFISKRIDS